MLDDVTGIPADPAGRHVHAHESGFISDNQLDDEESGRLGGVLPQYPSVLGLSGNPSEQAKYRCPDCTEPFLEYSTDVLTSHSRSESSEHITNVFRSFFKALLRIY
jgi:hypothetical protein